MCGINNIYWVFLSAKNFWSKPLFLDFLNYVKLNLIE